MKVKQEILEQINTVASRRRILDLMDSDLGDQALYKQIKENAQDGPLTRMKALRAISELLAMPVDQILEEELATVNK